MTEAQLNAIIESSNTALLAALANPKPSYRIGEYSVDHNAYLKNLRDTISWAQEQLGQIPCEEFTIWRPE